MAKRSSANQQQDGNRDRVVTQNRRAFFDYFIDETVEAGVVLTGSEIKSIREGKVTISEAYVRVDADELWLIGANITPYVHGAYANHDPNRPRKLLVHKSQIAQLREAAERRGMTLVPLRLRLRRGLAKVDVGMARGKKLYDKRQVQAERDSRRQIDQALAARE